MALGHVDAKRHFFAGAPTIEALDLNAVVGTCDILDLSDIKPNEAITATRLERARKGRELAPRLLIKTCWDEQRSVNEPSFWHDAPYLTRDAANWLLHQEPFCTAFDFPQDYAVRKMLDGEILPFEEHVSHDVLLRNNVTLVEYLCGTRALTTDRIWLSAAPLKIVGADGGPARIFAILPGGEN